MSARCLGDAPVDMDDVVGDMTVLAGILKSMGREDEVAGPCVEYIANKLSDLADNAMAVLSAGRRQRGQQC